MSEEAHKADPTRIASVLMSERDLPRDEFGWPYRLLLQLDGRRVTGLVYDKRGDVMVCGSTPEGPALVERASWQPAPDAVAVAASEWWALVQVVQQAGR